MGFALLPPCSRPLLLDWTPPGKSHNTYMTRGARIKFIGGRIYAIRQSADGYLWVGTERGLVRFDGSNFILIQRPLPRFASISPVRDLVTDASGNPLDSSRRSPHASLS